MRALPIDAPYTPHILRGVDQPELHGTHGHHVPAHLRQLRHNHQTQPPIPNQWRQVPKALFHSATGIRSPQPLSQKRSRRLARPTRAELLPRDPAALQHGRRPTTPVQPLFSTLPEHRNIHDISTVEDATEKTPVNVDDSATAIAPRSEKAATKEHTDCFADLDDNHE